MSTGLESVTTAPGWAVRDDEAENKGDSKNMTVSPWTVSQVNYCFSGMVDDDAVLQALGKRIRAARKAKGITQERLAELCEFDPTYISLLERGQRNPPYVTLCKIAYHLEVPVNALVP